jgi:hypothetical protein
MKTLFAFTLLLSPLAALAADNPDVLVRTVPGLTVAVSPATLSCSHVEDAITESFLIAPNLTSLYVLPHRDDPLNAFGANACEHEIKALLSAASANGGTLNATLTVRMRVEKTWSQYFGCQLSNVETDTLAFGVLDRFGQPVQFETGGDQLIQQLAPADCGVKEAK